MNVSVYVDLPSESVEVYRTICHYKNVDLEH